MSNKIGDGIMSDKVSLETISDKYKLPEEDLEYLFSVYDTNEFVHFKRQLSYLLLCVSGTETVDFINELFEYIKQVSDAKKQEYTGTCHVWEEVRNEKVENETVKKEQSHVDLTELKENIQSLLIQNTDNVEGINYTKLKNKTYAGIKGDVIKDPFIYAVITPNDIKREIDRQTMMLIALGLLESINGYIFNPNKIRVGEHIQTVIKKELRVYKQIYKETPIER